MKYFVIILKRFLIRYNGENNYSVVYALNKTNIFDNMYISRSQINDIIESMLCDKHTESIIGGWLECISSDIFEANIFIANKNK